MVIIFTRRINKLFFVKSVYEMDDRLSRWNKISQKKTTLEEVINRTKYSRILSLKVGNRVGNDFYNEFLYMLKTS